MLDEMVNVEEAGEGLTWFLKDAYYPDHEGSFFMASIVAYRRETASEEMTTRSLGLPTAPPSLKTRTIEGYGRSKEEALDGLKRIIFNLVAREGHISGAGHLHEPPPLYWE